VLFNSYPFVFAFLPAVLVGFFLLRRQGHRLLWVVLASYVFYAYEEWWFPALMISSTAISFAGGLLIERTPPGARQKWILGLAIAGCLSLLAFFKYAEFLAGYASSLVATITEPGLPGIESLVQNILLPAGISFYTFESISYLVDVKRGTIPAERNPLRYAFFISFFPHLIAGPIVRYGKLGPQLARLYRFDVDLFRAGLLLFVLGLAKKVIVADGIAFKIDPLLENPAAFGFVDSWLVMFGYAFQIYFDFSAYTDMALGLALMFGIELPWNFDRPYRAASPSEFWRRWHVTLSSWRVLAPLARHPLELVARLPLHPARGQPEGPGPPRREPAGDDGARRALARRLRELPLLGPLPRRDARRPSPSRGTARATAPRGAGGADVRPRDGRLGLLPAHVRGRDRRHAACDGRPERRRGRDPLARSVPPARRRAHVGRARGVALEPARVEPVADRGRRRARRDRARPHEHDPEVHLLPVLR
jgi:hypothetical protein